MCSWRSASPSGITPPPHPAQPSLPSQHPLLLLLGWSLLLLSPSRWSFSRPAPCPRFFFFLSPAALSGVTRLLKQCWHLYQADLTLCPFPPSLHLLSSFCTPGSITLTTTHFKKIDKWGKQDHRQYNQKKYKFFLSSTWNKHLSASSTSQ